ncbi:hypothetical protein GCM10007301_36560 [Azorhizobium oxalatiphilum]|uniref:Uncharacterized protein n=1 Tax=Azorhizobium oxalatiphilum TaxID=980631 RepID=A0A917C5X9_9HYPH|nr:hypothetical protein [Azorhizobium oxalatiphilum]GGF73438.1 hypothetical protein GCM10007301_36560 [Azorhizobium oxalatiphilum]
MQLPVENVAWRRICRPVPRWAYGHRVMVNKCERVWVGHRGGPRYYGGGPRYDRGYGPPPPRFGGGYYRGGPGYY